MSCRRAEEIGCARAWMRADGAAFLVAPDEHTRLRAEWMMGRAFFDGHDVYGAVITLKLGEVVAVGHATAEQCAEAYAIEREDRLEL